MTQKNGRPCWGKKTGAQNYFKSIRHCAQYLCWNSVRLSEKVVGKSRCFTKETWGWEESLHGENENYGMSVWLIMLRSFLLILIYMYMIFKCKSVVDSLVYSYRTHLEFGIFLAWIMTHTVPHVSLVPRGLAMWQPKPDERSAQHTDSPRPRPDPVLPDKGTAGQTVLRSQGRAVQQPRQRCVFGKKHSKRNLNISVYASLIRMLWWNKSFIYCNMSWLLRSFISVLQRKHLKHCRWRHWSFRNLQTK